MAPSGFPDKLTGDLTWEGVDYQANPDLYVVQLSKNDITDIENALKDFNQMNAPPPYLSPDTFPLSGDLSNRLQSISDILHSGRGFAILRGLDPAKYVDEGNVNIFVGLSSYVGDKRGFKLNHLYDCRNSDQDASKLLPPNLAVAMSFHTDVGGGDNLALFVQSTSDSGGSISLASFWQLYNIMAAADPGTAESKALSLLTQNWPWEDTEGSESGEPLIVEKPIIYCRDDKVQIRFARTFLKGSPFRPRSGSSPLLTSEQDVALDTLFGLAGQHSVKLTQQPGDIVFVNNLAILHSREAFTDGDNKRHLIRMSIRDTNKGWTIPDDYKDVFDKKFNVPQEKQQLWTKAAYEAVGDGALIPAEHD